MTPITFDETQPTTVVYCPQINRAIQINILPWSQLDAELQSHQNAKISAQASIDTLTPILLQRQQIDPPPIIP